MHLVDLTHRSLPAVLHPPRLAHSLSILFFDTENLRYSLRLQEQVSRMYKQP
jgi:hypothetical protein